MAIYEFFNGCNWIRSSSLKFAKSLSVPLYKNGDCVIFKVSKKGLKKVCVEGRLSTIQKTIWRTSA